MSALAAHTTRPTAGPATRFEALSLARLDALLAVEQQAYSHPWTRGNFIDTLTAGYQAELLLAGDELIGYYVAMQGVQEAHLLNVTVAPRHQGQGWARVLLEALNAWARSRGAQSLWLEVRKSNTRARQIYETHGYHQAGVRKAYYPATGGLREDAIVMHLNLCP